MTSFVRYLPWRGYPPASLYVPKPASSDLWKRNGNHFICSVVFLMYSVNSLNLNKIRITRTAFFAISVYIYLLGPFVLVMFLAVY